MEVEHDPCVHDEVSVVLLCRVCNPDHDLHKILVEFTLMPDLELVVRASSIFRAILTTGVPDVASNHVVHLPQEVLVELAVLVACQKNLSWDDHVLTDVPPSKLGSCPLEAEFLEQPGGSLLEQRVDPLSPQGGSSAEHFGLEIVRNAVMASVLSHVN